MKKIAIVTDAWRPQINGVVTTLSQTVNNLQKSGCEVLTITPEQFRSIPCPTYPEIRLALTTPGEIAQHLNTFNPNAVHIATEGPLGWAARKICVGKGFPFTTSYHTRFPEYVRMRCPIPLGMSYKVVRRFHSRAERTMVATDALKTELQERGFKNLVMWSRGVDTKMFRPRPKNNNGIKRPLAIYLGRVAVEKNIEAFMQLDFPGTKCVIGDGPAREQLASKYPNVLFTGYKTGDELASLVADSDVFVFPSLTDTFGVVLLEAMACGVPVAAFPVCGPLESVVNGMNGYLDNNLKNAVQKALTIPPKRAGNMQNREAGNHAANNFTTTLPSHRSLSTEKYDSQGYDRYFSHLFHNQFLILS